MKKVLLLAGLVASMPALAQDEGISAWSGESELGFSSERGNTNEDNLLFKQKIAYEQGKWLNTFNGTAENKQTKVKLTDDAGVETEENVRTAEEYFLKNKLDYFFTDQTYGFVRLSWEKDRFSGFENQASEVVGLGYSFFPKDDTLTLKLELGAGQRQDEWDDRLEEDLENDIIPGQTQDQNIAFFSDEFVWKFSEGAELGQSLNVEYGKDNTVSRFEVYTKAQLVAALSMKVSYEIKYTDVVPQDTEDKDTKLNVSLLYSF